MLLSDKPSSSSTSKLAKQFQEQRVFDWIETKLHILEEKAKGKIMDKNVCDQFKREVTQNIRKLVQLNPGKTVKMIEEKFGSS